VNQKARRSPKFVAGRTLCRRFYDEVVGPLLNRGYPSLPYSAALIGPGSEVMGFDTPMSRDHNWGPRLQLFLPEDDYASLAPQISATLSEELPPKFLGYPTAYVTTLESHMPSRHRVEIVTSRKFFSDVLGIDVNEPMLPADWLSVPQQELRSIADGTLFRDDLKLAMVQRRLNYYPNDVWRYLLASGWERIGQEEHLVGRAGFVGDELGASVIAARLTRDLMRLCFLMERVYEPYAKWFGTAFQQLACAESLSPIFHDVLRARGWRKRDSALAQGYEAIAAKQNDMDLMPPRPARVQPFHDRPFSTIALPSGFAAALRKGIEDPQVKALAERRNIGNIDQFSDSTDLLSCRHSRAVIRDLYC